jgi:hypothetical protein
MSKIQSRSWKVAIAAALVIASILAYSSYESLIIRHGDSALLFFQTLDQAVRAEAKLLVAEATESTCESTIVNTGGTSKVMQHVTLDSTWEIHPNVKDGTSPNIQVLKGKIQAKLMSMISGYDQSFRYYYPNACISVEVSAVDSGSQGSPSILVSLHCNN